MPLRSGAGSWVCADRGKSLWTLFLAFILHLHLLDNERISAALNRPCHQLRPGWPDAWNLPTHNPLCMYKHYEHMPSLLFNALSL
jgi:hypothetical protein